MKNLFAFIIVGAAVLMVWFLVKKKTETHKGYTALGGCASLPPELRAACLGIKVDVLTPVKVQGQLTTGKLTDKIDASWLQDIKPSAYTGHVTDSGLIAQFAGNGALELFTGNGALELYTGTVNGTPARASWFCKKNPTDPRCNPTIKPSCLSLWLNNVNNPNGPLAPIWPGLTCNNSKHI